MAHCFAELGAVESQRLPDITDFVSYNVTVNPAHLSQNCDIYKGTYHPPIDAGQGSLRSRGLLRAARRLLSFSSTYTQRRTSAVAVKVFRLYMNVDEQNARIIKTIRREVQIWSKLSHLNVLRCLGFVKNERHFALVSPWMGHGTILQYVKSRDPPNEVDILEIFRGIADGLQYLHDRNIVHADLKCANVLASATGTPLLVDFGISRIASESSGDVLNTVNLYGTTAWTAIELLGFPDSELPDSSTDASCLILQSKESDIWAFGMTVVELLTRKSPYPRYANDSHIVLAIHRGVRPSMPSKSGLSEQVITRLWKLCERCWSTNPIDRPTIQDTLKELHKISLMSYLEDSSNCTSNGLPDSISTHSDKLQKALMLRVVVQTIIEIHSRDELLAKAEHESVSCRIVQYCLSALNAFLAVTSGSSMVSDDNTHCMSRVLCLLRSISRRLEIIQKSADQSQSSLTQDEFMADSEISKYVFELGYSLKECAVEIDVSEGYLGDRARLEQRTQEAYQLAEILCQAKQCCNSD